MNKIHQVQMVAKKDGYQVEWYEDHKGKLGRLNVWRPEEGKPSLLEILGIAP